MSPAWKSKLKTLARGLLAGLIAIAAVKFKALGHAPHSIQELTVLLKGIALDSYNALWGAAGAFAWKWLDRAEQAFGIGSTPQPPAPAA